jgi:hypothetical protein
LEKESKIRESIEIIIQEGKNLLNTISIIYKNKKNIKTLKKYSSILIISIMNIFKIKLLSNDAFNSFKFIVKIFDEFKFEIKDIILRSSYRLTAGILFNNN